MFSTIFNFVLHLDPATVDFRHMPSITFFALNETLYRRLVNSQKLDGSGVWMYYILAIYFGQSQKYDIAKRYYKWDSIPYLKGKTSSYF